MKSFHVTLATLAYCLLATRVRAQEPEITDPHSFAETVIGGAFEVAKSGILPPATTFLFLGASLVVALVVAQIFHKFTRVTYLSIGAILLILSAGTTYEFIHPSSFKAVSATQSEAGGNAFIVRGKTIQLQGFEVALHDTDTLKVKVNDIKEPWAWNVETFKKDGIRRFLEAAIPRLRAEFKEADDAVLKEWPSWEWYEGVLKSDDPKRLWDQLFNKDEGTLRRVGLTSRRTNTRATMYEPFSKWPLAHISVRRISESDPVVEGWYPDGTALEITDNNDKSYRFIVKSIFNGSRKIGEPEACVIQILSLRTNKSISQAGLSDPQKLAHLRSANP